MRLILVPCISIPLSSPPPLLPTVFGLSALRISALLTLHELFPHRIFQSFTSLPPLCTLSLLALGTLRPPSLCASILSLWLHALPYLVSPPFAILYVDHARVQGQSCVPCLKVSFQTRCAATCSFRRELPLLAYLSRTPSIPTALFSHPQRCCSKKKKMKVSAIKEYPK